MQLRVRKTAHLFERSGLALAGAACGLFVGAYVGSSINALTTQGFLLAMMLAGAAGFYLGIDTPPLPFSEDSADPGDTRIDAAEFLSAVGTLLATLTAFVSVGVIVLREEPHMFWTWLVLFGWVGGVAMQILAGAKARMRK
ncbi:MAG: hypothetical protein HY852_04430 [Bradyrhizobium sp.]|uniref:hypothetical protein n=1 Tax=Bradyrhizobium sp. TaxID=376 RepID=UPI0025C4E5E2|nr:hypothetical protein [Bradyrhizobium sp.]MBI5261047.1 hypothetical protein [Bradyrhizobium sp.]